MTLDSAKWERIAQGLYVSELYGVVITDSGDSRRYWTIRELLGWGKSLSGQMMPDYGDFLLGQYRTLGEAKTRVENIFIFDSVDVSA
jgi:hypothetical protein